MATSSMPTVLLSRQSMASSGVACEQYYGGNNIDRGKVMASPITYDGEMRSSLILGCSRWSKPIDWRVNPDEETTNWRARRGKTAHRVRREGMARVVPYPYPTPAWILASSGRGGEYFTLFLVIFSPGTAGLVAEYSPTWACFSSATKPR